MSHQPQRTCVACRARRASGEMLRVAAHNGIAPQLGAKARGRGAYLCYQAECAKIAWKRRALERALKLKTPFDAAFKAQVESAIEAAKTAIISGEPNNELTLEPQKGT